MSALYVAGIVFALVAILHLVRWVKKAEILVNGKPIPMWVSQVGFVVALLLSIWMFMA
ncbi:MAG: hypothetical protein SFW66_01595 [Gammaproteobacteria bacterium]|nr:hypothetical protein [Gammaproteobacteria bacterium]